MGSENTVSFSSLRGVESEAYDSMEITSDHTLRASDTPTQSTSHPSHYCHPSSCSPLSFPLFVTFQVAAVANQFIIREIDPDSPDFLYSSNLWDVAERNDFYSAERDGPRLDFLKTFAPMRAHSPYVTRCVRT
jgi:hypothetical protein